MNGRLDETDPKTQNGKTEVHFGEVSDVTHVLYDAGDFQPYDPTQELIFPPELKVERRCLDLFVCLFVFLIVSLFMSIFLYSCIFFMYVCMHLSIYLLLCIFVYFIYLYMC